MAVASQRDREITKLHIPLVARVVTRNPKAETMKTRLLMLYKDTPRKNGYFCAIFRHDENDGSVHYSTAIMTGHDSRTTFMIQPLEDSIAVFSNRKTEVQPFYYISRDDPNPKKTLGVSFGKGKGEATGIGTAFASAYSDIASTALMAAPPVLGFRPKLLIKQDGRAALISEDAGQGLIFPSIPSYFSHNELLQAKAINRHSQKPSDMIYRIEMMPKTLMTISHSISNFIFYLCNQYGSRDFFIGTQIYCRSNEQGKFDENGADPDKSVFADVGDRMVSHFVSLGII